jgi:hypothetical protein
MLRRDWIGSPNYSNRNSTVRLIVLHTAEGALTYQSLGAFFANPASGVSSHVGIDDTPGVIGEYVQPDRKAWTQAEANPYSVAAELCAFASWDTATWHQHQTMLENTAAWVREEATRFGIPLVLLNAAEAQTGAHGVCQHADLGTLGGNHWDCGPGFPINEVMAMAGGIITQPDQPHKKGRNMIASTESGQGYWTVTSDGAIGAFGDAEYHGGAFDFDESLPGRQPMAPGTEIIGIAGKDNDGYWLYASDGGVFTFGSAQFYGRPDRA